MVYNRQMKTIPLTHGYFTKVDDDDYERLASLRWYANTARGEVRALRTFLDGKKQKTVPMSRFIMGEPKGMIVDHINGDTLDNRKSNLRICTILENQWNRKKSKKNTSGYIGVVEVKRYRTPNKFCSHIKHNKKNIFLGVYSTAKEAAIVYNEKALALRGKFATLNIIN